MMLKRLLFVFIFLVCIPMFSQVGIGTTSPTATLDINGNLRVRGVTEEFEADIAKDSILVVSRDGIVRRIPSRVVISSALQTAVKGNFLSAGAVSLSLGDGPTYTDIPFDEVEFDLNSEYNTTTNVFTAKQDGIYEVNVQINSNSGIAASVDYGVCIVKNGAVVAKENYANINITVLAINVDVTPPVRKTNTLVQLTTGDTIEFQLFSELTTVDLSGSNVDSFFTIVQIR